MSSIGSVGGSSGLDIAELLKRLASQSSTGASGTTNMQSSGRPSAAEREQQFESAMAEALSNLGVSDDEASTIQDEIKSAIASAAQSSEGSTDGRDSIKNAIDSVLMKHDLDPDKVQEEFRSIAGPPPGGPPPGGAGGPGGANGSSSSSMSGASSWTSTQTTEELLKQLLDSGTLDSSTAQLLQGLLPSLDTTA